MELPQWMVEGLNTGRSPYLDVEVLIPLISTFAHIFFCFGVQVPKTYREVYREIMTADPLVVDLHKQGPYYYEFGRS